MAITHDRARGAGGAALLLALTALPAAAQHHYRHDEGMTARTHVQLEAVRAATERYRDHAAAVADGYARFGRDAPLMGEHWYRRDLVHAPLDLARPSTLQYGWVDGRRTLMGVAWTVYRSADEPLPEGFAGSADVWHVHDVQRIGEVLTEGRPVLRRIVQRARRRQGTDARPHLTMLHAWVWLENPDGVFALEHRALPYVRVGLPAAWAESGDHAAAHGTALLADDACGRELGRLRGMARLDGEQRRTLAAACAEAARGVTEAVSVSGDAATFNRRASAAWRGYAAVRDGVLTLEQQARLGSLVEHDVKGAHH